jgi:hypothetical protein
MMQARGFAFKYDIRGWAEYGKGFNKKSED